MTEFSEKWLPIVGYEGLYEISDCGRIRNVAHAKSGAKTRRFGRLRKSYPSPTGHLRVELSRESKQKRFYIHRLVAEAFIGPLPPGQEVDHRDGDPTNNSLSNLRYVTKSENLKAAIARRGYWGPKGRKQWCSKLTDAERAEIPRLKMEGLTYKAIADRFGVRSSTISNAYYRFREQSK